MFETLEKAPDSTAVYDKWIQSIPSQLIDSSVISYTGINLDDEQQRDTILFPLLRFNMHVIDFWLSHEVFEREVKNFDKKLTCTAWDLCGDHLEHVVTGFSGTNDTKNVLPLPIMQRDLPELEDTNERLRRVILAKENGSYKRLPANTQGMGILELLKADGIPVLVDAGALMGELNNKQTAEEWLKLTSPDQFDAAVYFDYDILQTIDRNDVVNLYDCSVYRDNLARCLVYLDDMHTRGTDLRFPPGWKACVTLSGDITRDKTVQACMRMRQLAKNQSISFWASYQADVCIRKLCKLSNADQITNAHVFEFICENSRDSERDQMRYWAANGVNYVKKMIGHKSSDRLPSENSMENLYVEKEFATLAQMYGEKKVASLKDITEAKLNQLASDAQVTDEIKRFVETVKANMIQKLDEFDIKKVAQNIDEEQEKELEPEQNQHRTGERPGKAEPAIPSFDKRLVELVVHGNENDLIEKMKGDGALMSMPKSLAHTDLYKSIQNDAAAWAAHLLVTRDFQTVAVSTESAFDEFLRPVGWLAAIRDGKNVGKQFLILLSRHESEQLKPAFRDSKMATLFPYRPRLGRFRSNLLHNRALQITGMDAPATIGVEDEVQIGVYSASMYFRDETESKAYCDFLGVIPRPRSDDLQQAFKDGIIQPNGFVPLANRQSSPAVAECVGRCSFHENPMNFVIKLIEAVHQSLPKETDVASIMWRGNKPDFDKTGKKNRQIFDFFFWKFRN